VHACLLPGFSAPLRRLSQTTVTEPIAEGLTSDRWANALIRGPRTAAAMPEAAIPTALPPFTGSSGTIATFGKSRSRRGAFSRRFNYPSRRRPVKISYAPPGWFSLPMASGRSGSRASCATTKRCGMWTVMAMRCRCPRSAPAWSAPGAGSELAGATDAGEPDRHAMALN
jgi:hypothetical protein